MFTIVVASTATALGEAITRTVLVLALTLLILSSCGGETTPQTPASTAATPATADVTVAGASTTATTLPETAEGGTPETGPVAAESTNTTHLPDTTDRETSAALVSSDGDTFPPPPDFPTGPMSDALRFDLDGLFALLESELRFGHEELSAVVSHMDIRMAWILTDFLRFANNVDLFELLGVRIQTLLGDDVLSGATPDLWKRTVDLLIAWDLPAFPEYREYKKRLFQLVEPGWEPFFADAQATIDWRWVSWGGVLIDDRPLGDTGPCNRGCIPALDDPKVTPASEGNWYPDDRVVFGVTINGESRAYPKNQMEIHEMVNDTLGGRRIGMPYCTLCGSAQAYFTDDVPEGIKTPVLRTSGLLNRSNKVMYDLNTRSVFDTFTGEAVSGPLREAGVRLQQATVVASTWGTWKEAHPDTTVLAEDGGLGRSYPSDPLRGRDDFGPIFPVGDVDTRLGVQDLVVGVELEGGGTIAFPREAALSVLDSGADVTAAGIRLIKDGDGLRAISVSDGSEIPSHQAFWFAWSQFWPNTQLWDPPPQ